jgi:very-short-patch-repair endonuclease
MRYQRRNQNHAFERWLRQTATLAEHKLWSPLRRLRSFKFRRQHRIERCIVDFYCARVRLAVELDGEIHFTDEAQDRDDRRTAFLRSLGIRISRFRNEEVLENIQGVVDRIEQACLFLE